MNEPSVQRRWRAVAVIVGATVLIGAMAVLATIGAFSYLENEISDNERPRCDREPVILEWIQREGRWSRSETFELSDNSQTVQVDLTLSRDDGGVIQTGKTVYVIPAGEDFPTEDDELTSTTQPFRGTVVGRGVDGVNEQVTLEAGQWQLIVQGAASAAEVRWPC